MSYPEWTKKFKKKGIYVGKNRYGFYLYRAHCVRDPITKKPKTIVDEYLGTITEKDGFIPKDNKFSNATPLEFGMSSVIYFGCKRELERHVNNESAAKNLMVCFAIIYYIYKDISIHYYQQSYLSVRYKDIDLSLLNENRQKRIINLSKRIDLWFAGLCPELDERQELLSYLMSYTVILDGKNYVQLKKSDRLNDLLKKYNLRISL